MRCLRHSIYIYVKDVNIHLMILLICDYGPGRYSQRSELAAFMRSHLSMAIPRSTSESRSNDFPRHGKLQQSAGIPEHEYDIWESCTLTVFCDVS